MPQQRAPTGQLPALLPLPLQRPAHPRPGRQLHQAATCNTAKYGLPPSIAKSAEAPCLQSAVIRTCPNSWHRSICYHTRQLSREIRRQRPLPSTNPPASYHTARTLAAGPRTALRIVSPCRTTLAAAAAAALAPPRATAPAARTCTAAPAPAAARPLPRVPGSFTGRTRGSSARNRSSARSCKREDCSTPGEHTVEGGRKECECACESVQR